MHAVLAPKDGAFPKRPVDMVAAVQTQPRDGRDPQHSPLLEGQLFHRDRSHNFKQAPTLPLRQDYGGGERATTSAECYPSLGTVFGEDYVLWKRHQAQKKRAVAFVPKFFHSFPENSVSKLWNWRIAKNVGSTSSKAFPEFAQV